MPNNDEQVVPVNGSPAEDNGLSQIEDDGSDVEIDPLLAEEAWSLQPIWNTQLTFNKNRSALVKREHIWASEIGKSYYERWLKMNAIQPDIQIPERVLRKFAAGDFFERIIAYVLTIAGIMHADNERFEIPADEEHLKVTGKLDFIAGGKPDWDKIKHEIETNQLFKFLPVLENPVRQAVELLSKTFPDGLPFVIYEVKSINSQVFWSKKKYLREAYFFHQLQCYTYLKAKNMPNGRVLYISKDDLTLKEFVVKLGDPELEAAWQKDIKEMTQFIRSSTPPPKPDNIVFDKRKSISFQRDKIRYKTEGMWVPNWEISWSSYLPTITGFKTEGEWLTSFEEELDTKNAAHKQTKLDELIANGVIQPPKVKVAKVPKKST